MSNDTVYKRILCIEHYFQKGRMNNLVNILSRLHTKAENLCHKITVERFITTEVDTN